MKNKSTILTSVVLLGALCWAPVNVRAGQNEWSTTGKILTGVVGLSVLQNVWGTGRVREATPCHRSAPTSYTRMTRCETYSQPVYYPPPRPRPRRCRPRPPCGRGPVIIETGGDQRLYQPRVHGHPAFVQVWSDYERRWVNVREHPSIW